MKDNDIILELDELYSELRNLKKREIEILKRIGELVDTDDGIEKLGLTVRIYKCLECAGIYTVTDIINYPKDAWFHVRNLSRRDIGILVIKMRSAGYTDFNICRSKDNAPS
jgi:DNA-directed RNA polymerase alpha subunit